MPWSRLPGSCWRTHAGAGWPPQPMQGTFRSSHPQAGTPQRNCSPWRAHSGAGLQAHHPPQANSSPGGRGAIKRLITILFKKNLQGRVIQASLLFHTKPVLSGFFFPSRSGILAAAEPGSRDLPERSKCHLSSPKNGGADS